MSNELVGTWRLETWMIQEANRIVWHPLGRGGTGVMVITADGWLSAHLAPEESVPVAPNQRVAYLGYAGRYYYGLVDSLLVTRVEISSVPEWVGNEQARDVELTGASLVLRPPIIDGATQELRWRRIT